MFERRGRCFSGCLGADRQIGTNICTQNWDRIIAGIWRRFVFFAEAGKHDSRDPKINLQLILLFLDRGRLIPRL